MDAKQFGLFISKCRKEKGMTQDELAQKLHVSDKAVSRWERGVGFPDINSIDKLADALDITILELMKSEKTEQNLPKENAEDAFHRAIEILHYQRDKSRRKCIMALLCYLTAAMFGFGIVAVNVEHVPLVLGYMLVMLATGVLLVGTLLNLYRGSEYYEMEMEGRTLSKHQKTLKTISVVFLIVGVFGFVRYSVFLLRILFELESGAIGRELLIASTYWALGKSGMDIFCGIIGMQVARKILPEWTGILIGTIYIVVTIVRQFYDFAILEVVMLFLPMLLIVYSYKFVFCKKET